MGLFGDMKKAGEISPDNMVFAPAQRIDTLVADPLSGEQRWRSDHAGTVWYGGRPEIVRGQPLPGRSAQLTSPFWLPDSHAYEQAAAGDVQMQASASVQGAWATSAGGNFQILEVVAALGEDPQSSAALRVYMTLTALAGLPFGVAYRVTVICRPDALRLH